MPRYFNIHHLVAAIALIMVSSFSTGQVQAQGFAGSGLGFLPYGFYQPYGATYQSTIRTPPYFATNPPVYYGTRHARPYGLSPFASPPVVSAGAGYQSRAQAPALQPNTPVQAPINQLHESCGCSACLSSKRQDGSSILLGQVKSNPFVAAEERIARK